ncbi:46239_t:CDS:2, partial [Gigaspora margarita]
HEVIGHVSVTISSNNKEQYSYYINEIIYKFKDHWKIRNILLEYQHPSEYATVSLPLSEHIPVLKLFLDLYYDNFGTYQNVYYSLGGVYIQFGNMPISLRQQLRNHFVLEFVPFGGSFDKFIRPFIMEIKSLESGQIMNIQGQEYWVIASLGVVIADLPQKNDLASVKRHSANKGYRTCQVSKEHFTNNDLDFKNLSRYQHITNSQFHEIASSKSIQEHKLVATKYGLYNNIPILSQLIWDHHLQTPQDIYYATARKIMRLLKLTVNLFLPEGQKEFIEQRINANCTDLVSKSLIKCWVLVAKSAQLVFKKLYLTDDYKNLQKCLETESQILTQVFAKFENLPNLYINNHLPLHAHIYRNLVNTSVGTKEMVHRIFKNLVPQTNCKNIELDLLK